MRFILVAILLTLAMQVWAIIKQVLFGGAKLNFVNPKNMCELENKGITKEIYETNLDFQWRAQYNLLVYLDCENLDRYILGVYAVFSKWQLIVASNSNPGDEIIYQNVKP